MRPNREPVVLTQADNNVKAVTEPCRILGNDCQYWLYVRRRRGNCLQNCTCCRLLLKRLCKSSIPLLHLLKQADILDCNYSLIGKCRQEIDLLLSEWLNLKSPNDDCP